MKRCLQLGMLVAGVVSMSHVHSHHSYAQFDPCIDVTITGEVRAAEYANPHIVFEVETIDGWTWSRERSPGAASRPANCGN